MNPRYLPCDYRSLDLHRLVVEKIRQDPTLLDIARANIKRWKSLHPDLPQRYLDDWLLHINGNFNDLIDFMLCETDEAQRLRSSSPFVGIITQKERNEIFKKWRHVLYEKTST